MTLIEKAVLSWRTDNFSAMNSDEECYTIRVLYYCNRMLREHENDFPQIYVFSEVPQPTEDILLGRAHPKSSPRPDLTMLIGATRLRLEAKRLADVGPWAANYVKKGMARFRNGRYGEPGQPAFMLAYWTAGVRNDIVSKVNNQIDLIWAAGPDETLKGSLTQPDYMALFTSSHPPAIQMWHAVIDVRDIVFNAEAVSSVGQA